MSKPNKFAAGFLKKAAQADSNFTEGFEAVSPINTPSIALSLKTDLTEKEKLAIQKILVDDYKPGTISEEQVYKHVDQLTDITRQIKNLVAQSILLHGERIKQAQDLLANYREGAFSKWLMETYGNRQTPYSMLRYYEFYNSAPKELQKIIEAAPKKVVYQLATREGDNSRKLDFIKAHGASKQSDTILLMQETFPVTITDKRKPLMASKIEALCKLCTSLESRADTLSKEDRQEIKQLIHRLQKL